MAGTTPAGRRRRAVPSRWSSLSSWTRRSSLPSAVVRRASLQNRGDDRGRDERRARRRRPRPDAISPARLRRVRADVAGRAAGRPDGGGTGSAAGVVGGAPAAAPRPVARLGRRRRGVDGRRRRIGLRFAGRRRRRGRRDAERPDEVAAGRVAVLLRLRHRRRDHVVERGRQVGPFRRELRRRLDEVRVDHRALGLRRRTAPRRSGTRRARSRARRCPCARRRALPSICSGAAYSNVPRK